MLTPGSVERVIVTDPRMNKPRKIRLALPFRLLLSMGTAVAVLVSCGEGSTEDLHPLDQMSISFDGSPSRQEVQEALDPVMDAYGLVPSEENYSRAGSALTALTQKLGVPEMEVLDCMSRQRSRWESRGFAEGAGLSAFTIQEAGSCNPAAAGT